MKVPQIWWFHYFLDPMAGIYQICPLVFFWKNLRRQKYFMKLTNLYQLTNFVKNCILSGFVIKHMIEIKIVLFNLVISRSGWTFYRFADFQWLIILKQQQTKKFVKKLVKKFITKICQNIRPKKVQKNVKKYQK